MIYNEMINMYNEVIRHSDKYEYIDDLINSSVAIEGINIEEEFKNPKYQKHYLLITSMMKYYIIGVPKTGTTSIYESLLEFYSNYFVNRTHSGLSCHRYLENIYNITFNEYEDITEISHIYQLIDMIALFNITRVKKKDIKVLISLRDPVFSGCSNYFYFTYNEGRYNKDSYSSIDNESLIDRIVEISKVKHKSFYDFILFLFDISEIDNLDFTNINANITLTGISNDDDIQKSIAEYISNDDFKFIHKNINFNNDYIEFKKTISSNDSYNYQSIMSKMKKDKYISRMLQDIDKIKNRSGKCE